MSERLIRKIRIDDSVDMKEMFGNLDHNIERVREVTGTEIIQREDNLILMEGEVDRAETILMELIKVVSSGEKITEQKLNYIISLAEEGVSYAEQNMSKDVICFTTRGKPIRPKTLGQKHYVDAIREKDVVFGIGPAGTGKTYIAVAMAINAFKNKEVQKIVLARPAVEAGESLGFLPGDLQEKVDPYLRPLYDGLYDILGRENAMRLKEKEAIEVVPLAYMRGRTLDDAFIILDEAQNTTQEQMKMFLTRMGFGSKVVVTGDVTQIDLPKGKKSGLLEAQKILKNIKGIEFCELKDVDVVRHEMVKRIIRAYDNYYRREKGRDRR